MNQLIAYAHNPLVVLAAYAAFNLLTDTMPEPKPDGGNGYLWLFKAMHAICQNWKTARGLKMMVPSVQTVPPDIAPVPPLVIDVQAAEKARKANGLSGFERQPMPTIQELTTAHLEAIKTAEEALQKVADTEAALHEGTRKNVADFGAAIAKTLGETPKS